MWSDTSTFTVECSVNPSNAQALAPRNRHWFFMPFALTWAGLILYGTLLPFDLRRGSVPAHALSLDWLLDVLSSPRWLIPSTRSSALGISELASDLAVNLLLMLPLGLFLRLHYRHKRSTLIVQWLKPLLLVSLLCWAIESAQSLLIGRVGSIPDVLTNLSGAIAGMAIGPWSARTFRLTVFHAFRKFSYRLHQAEQLLLSIRRSPITMFSVTMVNLLFVGWYFAATRSLGEGTSAHVLPFMGLFERSYDVGALYAGRAMIVYCLVGGLLSIQFLRLRSRRAISLFLLVMAVLAFGRQLLEASGAAPVDLTENFIAITAGGFVLTTIYLLFHAVRCSCRRRVQTPVAVERRRVPFQYRHPSPA